MDLGLNGKVAVVTASSRGLGKAVALKLAQEGANVVICARNKIILKEAEAEIKNVTQSQVLAIQTDVTRHSDVKELIRKTIDTFGKIDILVTNAGGPPAGTFLDFSIEDWKNAIELNLMSTIYLTHEVIPHMLKQQYGRIVMITSVSVKQPLDNLILSNVARAGVVALAKSLSNEFGDKNILVNVVAPGYTMTERLKALAEKIAQKEGITEQDVIARWEAQNALKRIGTPEEFANVVVFLVSDRASYITGTTLAIDGGFVKSLL